MSAGRFQRIRVIDSHTGGEPTRIIVEGGPDLGGGTLAARRDLFRERFDDVRRATVNEPRGSDVIVGGLLCEPHEPGCACGVIYFNNVGTINMCVHGTIGLMVTLEFLGRVGAGEHRIDTPVGVVAAELLGGGRVRVRNVPSHRHAADVPLDVDGHGRVHGDVAWGGNWFFLVSDHGQDLSLSNVNRLTDFCVRIRAALQREGVTGAGGGEIDHVELFGPPRAEGADSRNFVLCPGAAYDRSPCGTGTSAKLACLAADGRLKPGEVWRQESIVGSVFEGAVEPHADGVIPVVTGSAYITADAILLLDPDDPFRAGIPA